MGYTPWIMPLHPPRPEMGEAGGTHPLDCRPSSTWRDRMAALVSNSIKRRAVQIERSRGHPEARVVALGRGEESRWSLLRSMSL